MSYAKIQPTGGTILPLLSKNHITLICLSERNFVVMPWCRHIFVDLRN